MKTVGVLIIGLILVFAFTGLQDVSADQADEAYKTGLKYYYGDSLEGIKPNPIEGMKWLRKAAEQGNERAIDRLYQIYYYGDDITDKNYEEAFKWSRLGAYQGYADAQYYVGEMYENGKGVKQNYAEALKWYEKAAEQGDDNAQFNLYLMYRNGDGVTPDSAEAFKWIRKLADQGNAFSAFYTVGEAYYLGQGVKRDYIEAMKWFRKAADQGNAEAEYNIGVMYEKGEGVVKDSAEAIKWFQKAAEEGHQKAEDALKALK
jgi:TPR repeat protein